MALALAPGTSRGPDGLAGAAPAAGRGGAVVRRFPLDAAAPAGGRQLHQRLTGSRRSAGPRRSVAAAATATAAPVPIAVPFPLPFPFPLPPVPGLELPKPLVLGLGDGLADWAAT